MFLLFYISYSSISKFFKPYLTTSILSLLTKAKFSLLIITTVITFLLTFLLYRILKIYNLKSYYRSYN